MAAYLVPQDIIEYVFAYLPLKLSSTLNVVLQEFLFVRCGSFAPDMNWDRILTLQVEANAANIKA